MEVAYENASYPFFLCLCFVAFLAASSAAKASITDAWTITPKGLIGGWRNDIAVSGSLVASAKGKGASLYEVSGNSLIKKSTLSLNDNHP
ncbi:MAG: hypothetical protein QM278_05270 [Pseudomonadota bacterium]|nr:hypothetical protein [Pseudomonadota bacterium]